MRFFCGALLFGASLVGLAGCGGEPAPGPPQTAVRRAPSGGGQAGVALDHCEVLRRCCLREASALKPVCLETAVTLDGQACEGALVAYECDEAPPPVAHDARYL